MYVKESSTTCRPPLLRRAVALLLVILTLFSLFGCAAKKDAPLAAASPRPTSKPVSTPKPTATPAPTSKYSDYTLGNANTMSTFLRPNLTDISTASPVRRQDQMPYFVNNGILCKRPADSSAADSKEFFAFKDTFKRPLEMQVIGNWIYIYYSFSSEVLARKYTYVNRALARISLDGKTAKTVLKDMSAPDREAHNTFVVRGEDVYYTFTDYTQVSATQYNFTTGLKRVDLASGKETKLFACPVDSSEVSMVIHAYTEDSILLGCGDSDFWLYSFQSGNAIPAPQFKDHGAIRVDNNVYYSYSQSDLYRYTPENHYGQEFCCTLPYSVDLSKLWNDSFVLDDTLYAATEGGIFAFQDGTRSRIVQDPAKEIFSIGDGYLYYTCVPSAHTGKRCYRIRPDGTDWGTVDWYM